MSCTLRPPSVRLNRASQRLVDRPRPAFGRGPVDDLVWIFDITSLAVHAVCRVDLQTLATGTIVDHFVDIGGAEVLARVTVLGRAGGRTDGGVADL